MKNYIQICISLTILSFLVNSNVYSQSFAKSKNYLITKYKNDTADFIKMKEPLRLNFVKSFSKETIDKKSQKKIDKKRSKFPKARVKDIRQASKWLSKIYYRPAPYDIARGWTGHPGYAYYDLNDYKEVEDGFLMKAKFGIVSDMIFSRCRKRFDDYALFFIGYDHNVLKVNQWKIDICPDRYIASVEIPESDISYTAVNGNDNEDLLPPTLIPDKENFISYLQRNIKYPQNAISESIEGGVIFSFIVNTDGSISDINLRRSLHPETDRPVLKVIKNTNGNWLPATQNNNPIAIKIIVRIVFKLKDNPNI